MTTKTEICKKAILSKVTLNETYKVKDFKSKEYSMDTVRKALNELCQGGDITKVLDPKIKFAQYQLIEKEESNFWKFMRKNKKKFGWKVQATRKYFSVIGNKMSREKLNLIIESDNKNTHIMIGNMNKKLKSTETGFQIIWDKLTKTYSSISL